MYPSLVLAYLGQGARLVVDGADVLPNLFYLTIPGRHNGPLFWILYVFAILATLIASQAMISATFSLVQQLVNQRCLPSYVHVLHGIRLDSTVPFRLHMVHTSDTVQGQIYIPVANWIREYPLRLKWKILKLASSYDSDHCYCRCFQQFDSAHQCLWLCSSDSHVYHKRTYRDSNALCQASSLDCLDFVFSFLRFPGW